MVKTFMPSKFGPLGARWACYTQAMQNLELRQRLARIEAKLDQVLCRQAGFAMAAAGLEVPDEPDWNQRLSDLEDRR